MVGDPTKPPENRHCSDEPVTAQPRDGQNQSTSRATSPSPSAQSWPCSPEPFDHHQRNTATHDMPEPMDVQSISGTSVGSSSSCSPEPMDVDEPEYVSSISASLVRLGQSKEFLADENARSVLFLPRSPEPSDGDSPTVRPFQSDQRVVPLRRSARLMEKRKQNYSESRDSRKTTKRLRRE